MADASDIFSLLSGIGKSAEADDPYKKLSDFSSQFGDELVKASPKYDLKDSLLASLVTGLTGGIFSGLSDNYENNQKEMASNAMRDILGGKSFSRGNLGPSVFNNLQIYKNAQDIIQAEDQRKNALEVEKTIAGNRFGNPLYEALGGSGGAKSVKATYGPDGQLQVDMGGGTTSPTDSTTGAGPSSLQSIIAKARQGQPLSDDENLLVSSAPPSVQSLLLRLQTKAAVDERAGNVGEKTLVDMAAPLAIGQDINKGLSALNDVYKEDPSLLTKAWNQLPLGSPAYNVFKGLQIDGARAAKALEGRVNETTLKLYTELLTSLNTEPIGSSKQRMESFVSSLKDDAIAKTGLLAAGGKNVDPILKQIETMLPSKSSAPLATSLGGSTASVPAGMKLQKNLKTGETRLVPK